MKTYTIKTPTAKLMILELPRACDFDLYQDKIYIYDHEAKEGKSIDGSYTLLGKPDEIREGVARLYVQKTNTILGKYKSERWFKNYKKEGHFLTATESLLSFLESEIYWNVNPLGKKEPKCIRYGTSPERIKNLEWREAEQKTFDRNRTLIFVTQ